MFFGERLNIIARLTLVVAASLFLLGRSSISPGNDTELVRFFTRGIEFDYIEWTLNAIGVKIEQAAVRTSAYLSDEEASQIVRDYADLIANIQRAEAELNNIYANPEIDDPDAASTELQAQLDEYYADREDIGPLAESILQRQVTAMLKEMDLTLGGQPVPPVLYHNTAVPSALIVSPRNIIQQDHNISLNTELTLEEFITLEDEIAESLNVSTLIVPIGGVGTYPTMVYQTSNINFLAEVVAHEWIHNYFNLRPLGLNYLTSPELRTINETAATLGGREIGSALIENFFPERVPPPPPTPAPPSEEDAEGDAPPPEPPPPPPFDFVAEMRETRVNADALLAEGKIEEAEAYMELRRQFLWDNGYRIRKLNQAYFAFHGAYAASPGGGAAGADPIGEAVRKLRDQSPSLADFLDTISWVNSVEELFDLVGD